MKKHLFTLLATLSLALPAAAADYNQALKSLKPQLDSSVFSGAVLSPQNQLMLTATDKYVAMPASGRSEQVSRALTQWQKALGPDAPANRILSIRWKDGGELWMLKTSGPARIDFWSDRRLSFTREQGKNRFFGYMGGQMMRGGDMDTIMAFNGRLGTTLFKNRCDAAVLFSYAKMGDYNLSSYGLLGRALFPLSEHVGWNVGGSYVRNSPSEGDAVNSIAVLGGINFYLPGGSFDVTVSIGNNSMQSLMIGYTLYLTRK